MSANTVFKTIVVLEIVKFFFDCAEKEQSLL